MKYNLFFISLSFLLLGACTKKNDFSQKVLHRYSKGEVKGFDPVTADDLYSGRELARIYEGLYEFHYLKRPYELVANLAESMPRVSEDGLTYTVKIRSGVVFQDNACFPSGEGRELVAQDFVYAIQRMADSKVNSPGWWLLDGKLVGLNEWRDKYRGRKADYSEVIPGLKALDKYTLQFKLTKPFPQFVYALAMPFTFAVAREAVEKYGQEFLNNPVGTGPFLLESGNYSKTNKITYIKNPAYRDRFYPSEGNADDKGGDYLRAAGKKLPLMDKIVTHIIVEDQPRWLNFVKGKLDFLVPPKDNQSQAIIAGELSKELRSKGIILIPKEQLDVTFRAFNHELPLFRDNPNLRRAMAMAFDHQKELDLFYPGQAIPAQGAIPPGIAGYSATYKNPYLQYNVKGAKNLLAQAGFPGGKGVPTIVFETLSNTTNRQMAEFFQKSMKEIGINIQVSVNQWPELQRKVKSKNHMMYAMAWSADYPDAENFLQLLYGPNKAPGANGSNFDNKEINALYERVSVMQDSPERTKLYEQLNQKIAELVPWIFGVHRQENVLVNGWVRNYRYSEMPHGMDKFIDLDLEKKKKLLSK